MRHAQQPINKALGDFCCESLSESELSASSLENYYLESILASTPKQHTANIHPIKKRHGTTNITTFDSTFHLAGPNNSTVTSTAN